MVATELPIASRDSGEALFAEFLQACESSDDYSPVVYESDQISLRFRPASAVDGRDRDQSPFAKLLDDSSACPELRKVAEEARKAAATREHKPHGFIEHVVGMSASLVGIGLVSCVVVGILSLCAIVIGVLLPFELI